MVLLCVTVVDKNSRKALLSWEIVESHSETDTIHEFLNSVLVHIVGSSKDSLTLKANHDLAVNVVVIEFGKFMKIFLFSRSYTRN